jgi:hypothetical protein
LFQSLGVDAEGKVVRNAKWSSAVRMRELQALGHTARLMSPAYVRSYAPGLHKVTRLPRETF